MNDTNGANPAATPAAASAPAAPASTSPVSSTPAAVTPSTGPASHAPVQDGQRGTGALTPEQSVDAMVSAFTKSTEGKAQQSETPVPPAEVKTAETQADPAQQDDAQPQDGQPDAPQDSDEYTFDEDGFTGARDLATKLDSIEALRGVLPDDLRGEIMANARIAETLAPYRELFGSPEEAKIVAKSAQEFAGVQQIFASIAGENVATGTTNLLNKMLEMSALRDDDGNPLKHANGAFKTDGTVTNFLNELYSRKFNNAFVSKVEQKIAALKAKQGDDNAQQEAEALQASFDLVMESAGLRSSTAAEDQLDPKLAARKAELDRQEQEINRQKSAAQQERVKQHTDALNGQLQSVTDGAIEAILKHATGVTDFNRKTVTANLTKAIKAAIRGNAAYLMEKDGLELRPIGKARLDAEVGLAKRFLRENLARIAKPVFTEAGISITKRQAEKQAAQAAREQSARGEVSGGAAPAAAAKANPASPEGARNSAREQLKQRLNREPTDSEINIEMMLNSPALKGRAA